MLRIALGSAALAALVAGVVALRVRSGDQSVYVLRSDSRITAEGNASKGRVYRNIHGSDVIIALQGADKIETYHAVLPRNGRPWAVAHCDASFAPRGWFIWIGEFDSPPCTRFFSVIHSDRHRVEDGAIEFRADNLGLVKVSW